MVKGWMVKGVLGIVFAGTAFGAVNYGGDALLYRSTYKDMIETAANKSAKACGLGKESRALSIRTAVYKNPGVEGRYPVLPNGNYWLSIFPYRNATNVLDSAKNFVLYPGRDTFGFNAETSYTLPKGVQAVLYVEENKQPVLAYRELRTGQMDKLLDAVNATGTLQSGAYVVWKDGLSGKFETKHLPPGVTSFPVIEGIGTAHIRGNPCSGVFSVIREDAGRVIERIDRNVIGGAKETVNDAVEGTKEKAKNLWRRIRGQDPAP